MTHPAPETKIVDKKKIACDGGDGPLRRPVDHHDLCCAGMGQSTDDGAGRSPAVLAPVREHVRSA